MEFTTILVTFFGVVDERAAAEDVKEEDFWRSVLATKGDCLEATAATKEKRRKLTNLPVGDETYSEKKPF